MSTYTTTLDDMTVLKVRGTPRSKSWQVRTVRATQHDVTALGYTLIKHFPPPLPLVIDTPKFWGRDTRFLRRLKTFETEHRKVFKRGCYSLLLPLFTGNRFTEYVLGVSSRLPPESIRRRSTTFPWRSYSWSTRVSDWWMLKRLKVKFQFFYESTY